MPEASPVTFHVSRFSAALLSDDDCRATFDSIRKGLAELLAPKPRLNIWQWAEQFRYVAKGVSAKTLEGPKLYRVADAPHQREPQEAPTDPAVQVTVYIMASQVGGKTEMFNNILGYHMHWAPRSCIVMYPTIEAAKKYSIKKANPMIEASPVLARIVRPHRSRDSGNTILSKDFRGGCLYFVGANSTTSLRQASGEVVLGDEIDSAKESAGVEGDSVELLFKRVESFPKAVKCLASTPTIEGLSPIWDWFESSDQRYWFVPCPRCAQLQTLTDEQVVWPAGEPEKAELICAKCQAALNDEDRLTMYFNGRWQPTAPFKGIRGFHLNGIYCPWPAQKGFRNRLHQMAEEKLRADKKGEFAQRVRINTHLCLCYKEVVDEIDSKALVKRGEDYAPDRVPSGVILVFCSVDVQKDRLELETIGLGLDDETWGIEYRKIPGDTEQDDVWQDLADHLGKTYARADGATLRISATTIDMRHKPHKVRNFVQRAGIPRVFPVYGVAGMNQMLLVSERLNKKYRLRTYAVCGRIAKDITFARLRLAEEGPRFMHFPKGHGYDANYFLGLTAEVLKRKKVAGAVKQNYEKIRDRNEPLDIRCYFLAGIDILKPSLNAIAKKVKATAPPAPAAVVMVGISDHASESPSAQPGEKPPADPAAKPPAPVRKKPGPAEPPPRKKIRTGGPSGSGWKV